MKLIERTASAIIVPGGIQSQGIDSSTVSDWASFSMLPQLGVGGCTPRPRKLSPASSRIAFAMPNVAATITGARAFGSMWRKMMRPFDAPTVRLASTNSRSRSDRNSARTIRAIGGQPSKPITIMML